MAQLTAQTLPIPEDSGSNPVINNFYITPLLLTVCRKYENKEKEAGNGPPKKVLNDNSNLYLGQKSFDHRRSGIWLSVSTQPLKWALFIHVFEHFPFGHIIQIDRSNIDSRNYNSRNNNSRNNNS